MVRSRPGSRNPKEGSLTKSPCPKFKRQVLSCSLPTKSGPPEVFVFHTVLGVEMAARAGIEPGRPIWPSLRMGFLADSYGSQELLEEPKNCASNGELFTIYAPEILVGRVKG
jgi:hypothetical protein